MPPQKILIVQLGRLGDFILATPMLRALKEDNPRRQIHVLASRHNHALARAHPFVDKALLHSKRIVQTLGLLARLKMEQYDYWIDPKDHFSRASRFFAGWARAKCKVGFNEKGKKAVFDIAVPSADENYNQQAAARNLCALRVLGLQHADPRPLLFVEPRSEIKLREFLQAQQIERYCCVHLSASREIRYWPQSNWIAFLRQIANEGKHFLLTCAPQDAALAREIAAHVMRARYYPAGSLFDLFSVVKHGDLVISPDTSVVHIAAAFDRPLLALYSNEEWNLKKFYPLSTRHRVVMGAAPGTLVRDIPLELMLKGYRDLWHEISS